MLCDAARPSSRRAGAIVAGALLTGTVLWAPPAFAQTPTPPPGDAVHLRLVAGPLWHEPGDTLGLRMEITNEGIEPIDGFRMIVGIEDRVLTRSSLENSFASEAGIASSALPFEFSQEIPGGGGTTVTLAEPLSSFPTLAGATEGGVYPASITLRDGAGIRTFASVKFPLIYHPQEPETPLNIVFVVPLNEAPNSSPGGSFIDDEGSTSLVEAVADNGWLTGYVDALDELTAEPSPQPVPRREGRGRRGRRRPPPPPDPLAVSLGVTPRTLEELADMADGFETEDESFGADSDAARGARRILDRLTTVARRATVQPLVIPYAFPDLPTLLRHLPEAHTLEQLSLARSVLQDELGDRAANGWLLPPAGRLDARSLEEVQLGETGSTTFFSHNSLVQPENLDAAGCPALSPSFTCPVEIHTVRGPIRGLASDEGLSVRLSGLLLGEDDRSTLQQFFAETAMIHQELPGVEGRVIQATAPSPWQPGAAISRLLLRGIRDAPWLQDVTADEALAVMEPVERQIVTEARALAVEPDPLFFTSILDADSVIDSYQSVVPPNNRRLARLRKNILVGQNRNLWHEIESARDYVSASRTEAESEMGKIGLEGAEDLTCTSRECQIQLVLTNETDYPVDIAVELESPDLTLDTSLVEEVFEPGNHPLSFDATVRGSGVFTVAVRLTSSDQGFLIEEKLVVIRSTNFNVIALGITIGAFAFLVLFYLVRVFRRRRAKASGG